MIRTHYSADLEEGKVKVAGFVKSVRDLGKIVFVVIDDGKGEMQITAHAGNQNFEPLRKLHRESFLVVEGEARKSEKASTGWEVVPEKVRISGSETPLPIDMEGDTTSLPKRVEWRFLDLRRKKVREIFEFQSKLVWEMESYAREKGFVRLFFSRISGEATEGGTEYFQVLYFDRPAYLAQSPQLQKELAMLSGYPGVYDLGFVYRAEPHHTTRHLCEYMSYDVEMVADELEDVLKFEEGLMRRISEAFPDKGIRAGRIPRISLDEANEILEDMGVETEEGDLTPEGERAIGRYVLENYDSDFVFITGYPFEKKPFYIMRDGEKGSFGFDLLFRGLEITSGGLREHRYEERVRNIRDKGLNPEDYENHLRFFKYGMPPHGGFAIGVERLTQMILGFKNIRETTLQPRDPETLVP